jgi:hypothetical protein
VFQTIPGKVEQYNEANFGGCFTVSGLTGDCIPPFFENLKLGLKSYFTLSLFPLQRALNPYFSLASGLSLRGQGSASLEPFEPLNLCGERCEMHCLIFICKADSFAQLVCSCGFKLMLKMSQGNRPLFDCQGISGPSTTGFFYLYIHSSHSRVYK